MVQIVVQTLRFRFGNKIAVGQQVHSTRTVVVLVLCIVEIITGIHVQIVKKLIRIIKTRHIGTRQSRRRTLPSARPSAKTQKLTASAAHIVKNIVHRKAGRINVVRHRQNRNTSVAFKIIDQSARFITVRSVDNAPNTRRDFSHQTLVVFLVNRQVNAGIFALCLSARKLLGFGFQIRNLHFLNQICRKVLQGNASVFAKKRFAVHQNLRHISTVYRDFIVRINFHSGKLFQQRLYIGIGTRFERRSVKFQRIVFHPNRHVGYNNQFRKQVRIFFHRDDAQVFALCNLIEFLYLILITHQRKSEERWRFHRA